MKNTKSTKKLTADQSKALLTTLKARFGKNMQRHKGISWEKVQERLESHPAKLWSVNAMEESGGEPDVVGYDKKADEYIFFDCTTETPKGRRNLCYDHEALEARKTFKPEDSAVNMADEMGVDMMTEEEYFQLQELGEFDLKTSSWLKTPAPMRKLDGALFGDRRFGRVFMYHNGAQSYYAVRGFRATLRV